MSSCLNVGPDPDVGFRYGAVRDPEGLPYFIISRDAALRQVGPALATFTAGELAFGRHLLADKAVRVLLGTLVESSENGPLLLQAEPTRVDPGRLALPSLPLSAAALATSTQQGRNPFKAIIPLELLKTVAFSRALSASDPTDDYVKYLHAASQHFGRLTKTYRRLHSREDNMIDLTAGTWPFFSWSPLAFLPANPSESCVQRAAQGEFISGNFNSGTDSLRYKLYIPSSYCGEPLPLVVMLHGCGQDADDFALGTGMNALAEQARCMVLYPEQSPQASWNRCWHWYDEAHHGRDEGEPALIAGLTQCIISEYAIERARVSVAGLSSGGAMAVILGRTYPDLFKAVGCHSGLAHGSATDTLSAMTVMRDGVDVSALKQAIPGAPIPMIVFHGDVDNTVHQKNSAVVVHQAIECYMAQAPGEPRETIVCEQTGENSGRHFTRHTHRAETGDVIAEHWTIHGAGHAWSGGNLHGTYTDTRGPDASKEMLRFFLNQ
jgi:poly(hydroxyalkanoate) depolymerase family esterase